MTRNADATVYVLDKNETQIAEFNKDDEDTIINPRIEGTQNGDVIFTFSINQASPKWEQIKNPENLYVVDNQVFSTNFEGCFEETLTENNEHLVSVKAYERQKLLSRKYVTSFNSKTGFDDINDTETIEDFMVEILSNGNLSLRTNGSIVTTKYSKGSSGYAIEGLLAGTDWSVGTCDVEGKYDLETEQLTIYDNLTKVQELWGGILVFDSYNKKVHHRDETKFLNYSGYEVKYQKNMQTLDKTYNNKIITKLCPLGEGNLNIKSVNGGSIWLTDFSYTDTVTEGIENNPDITDATQLKAWGQRKLKDLCKPRKELSVKVAFLKQVEGYELEDLNLNDIVDVINYNDIDNDLEQLRVVRFNYGIWDYSDAEIDLSDITLDSTDIFKKSVKATNSINAGTLDSSRVVNFFKNGQSINQTIKQIDRTIVDNKSELTKADDEIAARVTKTESGINDLDNEIVEQNKKISEIDVKADNITAQVAETYVTKDGLNDIVSKEVGSQIDVKANEITQSVSETYATKQEVTDEVSSAETSINNNVSAQLQLKVDKTDSDQIISMINASADEINLKSNRLSISSSYFSLTTNGKITATSGEIGGFSLSSTHFSNYISGRYDYSIFDFALLLYGAMEFFSLDSQTKKILDYNNDNKINGGDTHRIYRIITGDDTSSKIISGRFYINSNNPKKCVSIENSSGNDVVTLGLGGINTNQIIAQNAIVTNTEGLTAENYNLRPSIILDGANGRIAVLGKNNRHTYKTSVINIENSGITIENSPVYCVENLYSGYTTGTVGLIYSASNYDMIEIFYEDNWRL